MMPALASCACGAQGGFRRELGVGVVLYITFTISGSMFALRFRQISRVQDSRGAREPGDKGARRQRGINRIGSAAGRSERQRGRPVDRSRR